MMPERGDLLLIPYPFTDLSASKRRPALTSADAYGDFIGLPVTSRPRSETGIPLVQADMVHGILPTASWIRTDRIVTLNASLAVKTVGRVRERLVAEAAERLYARIRSPAAR